LHQITRKLVNAAVNVFLIHTAGDGKIDKFPSSDLRYQSLSIFNTFSQTGTICKGGYGAPQWTFQ